MTLEPTGDPIKGMPVVQWLKGLRVGNGLPWELPKGRYIQMSVYISARSGTQPRLFAERLMPHRPFRGTKDVLTTEIYSCYISPWINLL